MPTYTIPRINVNAWLEGAQGREIDGSRRSWIIQRQVQFAGTADDRDIADTRLDPGQTRVYEYDGPSGEGSTLVVSVDVEPDQRYRWMYGTRLELDTLTEDMERMYRLALEYPLAEPYNVTVIRVPPS